MAPGPEQQAREQIDRLLAQAGWSVQDVASADQAIARGVAIREFPLPPGQGFADYLLYADGKACGVIEAKKRGATLTGVEAQSARYALGLPSAPPAWRRPLPFVYERTGIETHFTQGLDPVPRARAVFAFHRPETLADWLAQASADPPGAPATVLTTDGQPPPAEAQRPTGGTMLARLQAMPPLVTEWGDFKLWPAQITAIRNLERSLAANTSSAFPLPDGWTSATIEQVAWSVEYGSSAKTSETEGGVPVLRMGNIVEGEIDYSELKYLPTDYEEFPRLLLEPGDLLFNRTNSPELVGKTAVFRGDRQCSFASYLIRVKTVSGCVPEFVAAYINSAYGRAWVKSVVTQQGGQANVNGTKLQALAIPLPPLAVQRRIVAEVDRRLSIVREVEAEVDANLTRAQALREAVLRRAFAFERASETIASAKEAPP
jgi:Type I restriction modification DNA specificity domain